MPKLLLLLALFLFLNAAHAQSDRTFTAAELREDLRFLKESIETYNPALGIFHRDTRFKAVYDSLQAALDGDMTDLEFYPFVVRLAEATKEGHTLVGSAGDTVSTVFRGFFDGRFKFLPVSLRYVDGKVHLWGNFSPDSTLQRGDEILRINGDPIEAVIEQLEAYAITDGHIPTSKRHKVAESFPSYYFWFYDRPEQFELQYRSYRSDEVKTITVPAINRDSMISWRNERYGKPEDEDPTLDDVYELRIENNIAHLQLKNFSRRLMERFKIKPRKLYKQLFKSLREKGVAHLVLDMRGNTGGRREYADGILPFLMKEPQRGTVYKDLSWKGKWSDNRFPRKSRWAFQGQLYVLTDEKTFSNGSMVATYARDYGDAIVIGRETASRYEGFAAGSRQSVTLPNTRIPVGIPRYLFLRDNLPDEAYPRNRGLLPDYSVTYTFEDLLEKRDKEWEQVERLIGEAWSDR